MTTNAVLKVKLKNKLLKWGKSFMLNPHLGLGCNNFTDSYIQAHDEIIANFMHDNFNTYDENGRIDVHWMDVERAVVFYQKACQLRIYANLRMQNWVDNNGSSLNKYN